MKHHSRHDPLDQYLPLARDETLDRLLDLSCILLGLLGVYIFGEGRGIGVRGAIGEEVPEEV